MHLANSDAHGPQISLSALGLICGLMGGGLSCLFVLAIIGHIQSGVELLISIPHNTLGTLTFLFGLYGAWLAAIWWFARNVRLIFWALAMFPVPSMLIGGLFAIGL